MSHTSTGSRTPSRPFGRRLATLVAALAVGAGTAGSCVLVAAPVASAASSSSDEAIASSAAKALAAWDRWEREGQMSDYSAYVDHRDETAKIIAFWLESPAASLRWAWSSTPIDKQHALLAALSQVGVPYRSRASKPGKAFDCSGLVQYAYGTVGIELPRSSRSQINATLEVDEAHAQAGDVLYYPGHISMYLGIGLIVHAPQSGMDVEVRHIFDRKVEFGDVVTGDALGLNPGPA